MYPVDVTWWGWGVRFNRNPLCDWRNLRARNRDVVRYRCGVGRLAKGTPHTLKETAVLFGLTPERIRQICARAERAVAKDERRKSHAT